MSERVRSRPLTRALLCLIASVSLSLALLSFSSEGLDQTSNANPYSDYDGRTAIRLMEPQSDSSQLAWADDGTSKMQSARWYPGAETLPDGSIMLIGGATDGVTSIEILRATLSVAALILLTRLFQLLVHLSNLFLW